MTALFTIPDLETLNREVDAALDVRVKAHRDRCAGPPRISVATYLGRLRHAREVEDRVEPQRRALGAEHSRAWERSIPELVAKGWSVTNNEWRPA